MLLKTKYQIEDVVYLKTDIDQEPRIVTCFKVYKNGETMYEVICGTTSSVHYDFEMTTTKNELIPI